MSAAAPRRPRAHRPVRRQVVPAITTLLVCLSCTRTPLPVTGAPGDPLPGLDSARLERFARGRELFHRQFQPEDGLGPLFNERRCSSCHDLPALGGTGVERAIKATRFEPPDRCDLLESAGGDNFQQRVTHTAATLGVSRERAPAAATARARLTPPSLFGLGLVEAIDVETLLALADPDDANGDGISGRPGRTASGQIGRFGRKAAHATLLEFIDTALRFEMGLTTPMHPAEERPSGMDLPDGADGVEDPEIDDARLSLLLDFVRYLAPPAPKNPPPAGRDSVERGSEVFTEIGCDTCHLPSFSTGSNRVPALDRKTVQLYSDLLLHDLGPEMASICGINAGPSEFRTAPLMGLRFRHQLMHDGRASSLNRAILLHGGEAQRSRDAFERLGPAARAFLLRFLGTL